MPRARRRREYSQEEITGLKMAAKILKDARLSHPTHNSLRRWADYLEEVTGDRWSITDIRRYEAAGDLNRFINRRKEGEYFEIVNQINNEYLKDVAPETDYSEEVLTKITAGLHGELSGDRPLGELIAQAQENLGEEFEATYENTRLSLEEIVYARKGIIRNKCAAVLAAFLSIALGEPITMPEVLRAAIAQLKIEVERESATDQEDSPPA